jgi:hypothetical protein
VGVLIEGRVLGEFRSSALGKVLVVERSVKLFFDSLRSTPSTGDDTSSSALQSSSLDS